MVTHIVHIQLLKIDATSTIDHLINIEECNTVVWKNLLLKIFICLTRIKIKQMNHCLNREEDKLGK